MSRSHRTTQTTGTKGRASRRRRPRRDATQWQALIERQANGRRSVRAFCRQHDLNEASFYDWRRRLRRGRGSIQDSGGAGAPTPTTSTASAGFVRLEPGRELAPSAGDVVEVRFVCGATLRCRGDRLTELVHLLKSGHGGEATSC